MPEGIDPSRTTTVLRMQIQPLHGSRGSQQDAQLQLCVPSMTIIHELCRSVSAFAVVIFTSVVDLCFGLRGHG